MPMQYFASNNMCLYFQKSSDMLNKNTLGVKKVQGQSEAALQIGMCDQKLWYQLRPRSYLSKIFLTTWMTYNSL